MAEQEKLTEGAEPSNENNLNGADGATGGNEPAANPVGANADNGVAAAEDNAVDNGAVDGGAVDSGIVGSGAPVENAPTENTTVESAPAESAPVANTDTENAPVENTSAVEDMPVESVPAAKNDEPANPVKQKNKGKRARKKLARANAENGAEAEGNGAENADEVADTAEPEKPAAAVTDNVSAAATDGDKHKRGIYRLSSLQQRVITSVGYVVVWIALCALKWCVPQGSVAGGWGSIGFDLAFTAVSVLGAFEFLRAIDRSESGINCKISFPQHAVTIAFCAMVVPLYAIVEMAMGGGLLAVACAFMVYVMFLAITSVFDHKRSSVKGSIYCVFCMLYCGVLSAVISGINHLNANSMAAILLLFMCSVLTDTGAFAIGSALKKFVPMKLAPQLSPNKTVIGAVGGVIGGVVGSILAYYLIYFLGGVNGEIIYTGFNNVFLTVRSEAFPPLLSFVLVGLVTSVMSQIGDLFESAIKRECGVKDMGRLLPGHGGVLDRFDSLLYCSVVVLVSFGTII